MATSTYLELVNKVLRKLNDVELTSANFADAINLQATVKDAVQDAVNEINHSEFEWPFNKQTTSQLLVVGQEEYTFPADYKVADWDSFYVAKDDSLSVSTTPLVPISKDLWFQRHRALDFDSESDGRDKPGFVFPIGAGWGVTPSPNQAYTVHYGYWKEPDQLSAHDDEVTIPTQWDYVIQLGTLWHMNLFKENANGVQLADNKFEKALNKMRTVLINKKEDFRDSVVNYGGKPIGSSSFLIGSR